MKIGTLLPSATEIVCVLGLEKSLVGVSHECDFPASVQRLPKLTSSSIGGHKSSGDIHRSVEALLQNSLSVYDLDLELLRSLSVVYLMCLDVEHLRLTSTTDLSTLVGVIQASILVVRCSASVTAVSASLPKRLLVTTILLMEFWRTSVAPVLVVVTPSKSIRSSNT